MEQLILIQQLKDALFWSLSQIEDDLDLDHRLAFSQARVLLQDCDAALAEHENTSVISYDFRDGQLIRLFHGRPEDAWSIYSVSDEVLRAAITWNDQNGDFENLSRAKMLEIFISDFIVDGHCTRGNQ